MLKVKDVSKLTGLSSRQVYDRLSALSTLLDGYLRTGQRGQKLIDDQGFAVFQRLLELEREGNSRESAIKLIAEELSTNGEKAESIVRKDGGSASILVGELRERIKEQTRAIERLEVENTFLRDKVDQLLPLALPLPKRHHCWWWPFRRGENSPHPPA